MESIADAIRRLGPSAGSTVIVAIDGCGGAGKSTFAAALAAALDGCPIVHTDDFASWEEPLNWWPRMIAQVFEPLSRGEPARYQRYDWPSRELAEWHQVVAPILIVEGVSATRREFRDYLAYRIWIDCPPDLRLQRGLERDGPAMESQWRAWMADEERYVTEHLPLEGADLVVDGAGEIATLRSAFSNF